MFISDKVLVTHTPLTMDLASIVLEPRLHA